MKVYTTKDFKGYWPVGSAAVVVADTPELARALFLDALAREHPHLYETNVGQEIVFEELPIVEGSVRILCDGNY